MPFHHDRSVRKFMKDGLQGFAIYGEGLSGILPKIAAIKVEIGILSFTFHALAKCRFRNHGCRRRWWWYPDIQSRNCGNFSPGTARVKGIAGGLVRRDTVLAGRFYRADALINLNLAGVHHLPTESRGLATFDTVWLQAKVDYGGQLRLRSFRNFGSGHRW